MGRFRDFRVGAVRTSEEDEIVLLVVDVFEDGKQVARQSALANALVKHAEAQPFLRIVRAAVH